MLLWSNLLFAKDWNTNAPLTISEDIVKYIWGDLEASCPELNPAQCIEEPTPGPQKSIQSVAEQTGELARTAREWEWVLKRSEQVAGEVDLELQRYEKMEASLKEDDPLVLKNLSQQVEQFAALQNTRRKAQAVFDKQCMVEAKNCKALLEHVKALQNQIESIQAQEPLLARKEVYDFLKSNPGAKSYNADQQAKLKVALLLGIKWHKVGLERFFDRLDRIKDIATPEEQQNLLRSPSFLTVMMPLHGIKESIPEEVGVACRLSKRMDYTDVANTLEYEAAALALPGMAGVTGKILSRFVMATPTVFRGAGFAMTAAAEATLATKEISAVEQDCDKKRDTYQLLRNLEALEDLRSCEDSRGLAMTTALITSTLSLVPDVSEVIRGSKLISTETRAMHYEGQLGRSAAARKFKKDYGQRINVDETTNREFIDGTRVSDDAKWAYEHEISKLKKCNDDLIRDKELCTAIDNFHYEKFISALRAEPAYKKIRQYGDYKSKAAATEATPQEMADLDAAYSRAFISATTDLAKKVDTEMPELRQLLLERGEGADKNIQHFYTGAIATGKNAEDKAATTARWSKAETATSEIRVGTWSEIKPRINREIAGLEERYAVLKQTYDKMNPDIPFLEKLDNGTVIPNEKAVEAFRKLKLPDRKRATGERATDQIASAKSDDAYYAIIKSEFKKKFDYNMTESEAIELTEYFHFHNKMTLGPQIPSRTLFPYKDAKHEVLSFDHKGAGAKTTYQQMKLYAQNSGLDADQAVDLARQAEQAATKEMKDNMMLLKRQLVEKLPDDTFLRLTNRQRPKRDRFKNDAEYMKIVDQTVALVHSGDDIQYFSRSALTPEDRIRIADAANSGATKDKFRSTIAVPNDKIRHFGGEFTKAPRSIENAERASKAIDDYLTANLPVTERFSASVMVQSRPVSNSFLSFISGRERLDLTLPKGLNSKQKAKIIEAFKASVPDRYRGDIIQQ